MVDNTGKSTLRITRINGYQVLRLLDEGILKVMDDDGQIGGDFDNVEDAFSYARSLRSRDPRNVR